MRYVSSTILCALLVVAIVPACRQVNEVTPVVPVITDQKWCAAACDRLNALGCEDGEPIDMGIDCETAVDCDVNQSCTEKRCTVSCERFCVETENAGVWLDPQCVATISTCEDVNNCPRPIPVRSSCTGDNQQSCPLPWVD